VSTTSGRKGNVTVSDGGLGLGFHELVSGADAILALGTQGAQTGVLLSSSTNTFTSAVEGLSITLNGSSTETVTAAVKNDTSSIASKLQLFVDSYNRLRDKVGKYYQSDKNTKGELFGSTETLQITSSLNRVLNNRVFANSQIQYLSALGVSISSEGKLSLDTEKFNAALASNPDAVKSFFTDENRGFAHAMDNATD
jgi:flagellar hook-associated protein 2